MDQFLERLSTIPLTGNLILSVAVIALVLLGRAVSMRLLRASSWQSEELALRWRVRIRNVTILLVILSLGIVWATEIRTLALSAVAIAAAIVIATKELIMCFGGGVLRASTESFKVGDRIEVKGHRGDVVHYGFMTTTILEIGPNHQRTGRAVVLPNSILLSEVLVNESFTDQYVLHMFSVPLERKSNWVDDEAKLLEAANEVCEPFIAKAKDYIDQHSRSSGLPTFSTLPRVTIQLPEAGKLNLLVRVPAPTVEKGRVEQEILRRYLAHTVREDVGETVEDEVTN